MFSLVLSSSRTFFSLSFTPCVILLFLISFSFEGKLACRLPTGIHYVNNCIKRKII